MTPTVGEICSGYGGLARAVEDVFGARTAWHCETDPHVSRVLAHYWPNTPNHGDITTVDWAAVEPVDILSGGTPCQDLSSAGKRAGMAPGTRSGLWAAMARAIAALRPAIVIWENVSGALSACAASDLEPCPRCMGGDGPHRPVLRAAGRVVGDLATLGYDAGWCTLAASEVGACHRRDRLWVVARRRDAELTPALLPTPAPALLPTPAPALLPTPAVNDMGEGKTLDWWSDWTDRMRATHGNGNGHGRSLSIEVRSLLPTPTTEPTTGNGHARNLGAEVAALLPTPTASLGQGRGMPSAETAHLRLDVQGKRCLDDAIALLPTPTAQDSAGAMVDRRTETGHGAMLRYPPHLLGADWGRYTLAVARHAVLLTGTPPPAPVDDHNRLNPWLVEWMMALPAGWVCDHLTRRQALHALGNGAVTPQAAAGIRAADALLTTPLTTPAPSHQVADPCSAGA